MLPLRELGEGYVVLSALSLQLPANTSLFLDKKHLKCIACTPHVMSLLDCAGARTQFPSHYLGHGRVQVVHDHVHDGCSSSRPAGVLLDWVGPAREVQPPDMMMAAWQASLLLRLSTPAPEYTGVDCKSRTLQRSPCSPVCSHTGLSVTPPRGKESSSAWPSHPVSPVGNI